MKKALKLRLMLVLLVVGIIGSPMTVFANNLDIIVESYLEAHYPGGSASDGNCAQSVSKFFTTSVDSTHTEAVLIGTNGSVVLYYNPNEADAIRMAVERQNDASNATDRITDITNGLSVGADTNTATVVLSGFSGLVSALLGVLVILATLGMTVFTGFDICYLVFPILRGKMEDSKASGGMMAQKTSDGGVKMRFVSDEAIHAVQSATVESGKNAMLTYILKRGLSYILLAVMIFILMTGRMDLIINAVLGLIDGLLEVLAGI